MIVKSLREWMPKDRRLNFIVQGCNRKFLMICQMVFNLICPPNIKIERSHLFSQCKRSILINNDIALIERRLSHLLFEFIHELSYDT